jgi:2,3,4,5-tetrahydropyridine-2,6-dicarboxylate N-succinyltransferase
MSSHQECIESYFQQRSELSPGHAPQELSDAIHQTLQALDSGQIRVCEKIDNVWVTHTWIKKAILMSFRILGNELIDASYNKFFDKMPLKFKDWNEESFIKHQIRVVPDAIVRFGAFISPQSILMPSYVNIGAYIGEGSMIDTWATVGSCAQIGKHVHLSGGAGIGGVLEPLQSLPTIIEDNCFVGARSEIVEGVIVEENSVIGMGVFIGQSTKIFNRATGEITYGRIPRGSVVVAGSLPSQGCHLYCAVIVKQVDAKTREKTSINELLRA